MLYGGAAAGGKALGVATLVPTPAGWATMGTLSPGDFVFGIDGKPTRVLACSEVMRERPCYQLTFDDGSSFVADEGHLWLTYTAADLNALTRREPEWRARRRAKRPSKAKGNKSAAFTAAIVARNKRLGPETKEPPTGAVRTTGEIARTAKVGKKQASNHAIPLADSLDCPDADLPIDPYVLGVWLGDGNTGNAGLTSEDDSIPALVRETGWQVTKRGGKGKYAWLIGETIDDYRSNGKWGKVNIFSAALARLGVLGNKHVPLAYLRSSREQRLALLQGLMDTDGTVSKTSGSAEFGNTNYDLALAVFELAASLGHKPNMREGRAKVNGKDCGPTWTIKWLPPEKVFRLARKADIQGLAKRRTQRFRYLVSCERIASQPVRCITVEATDGMFLAGRGMVPTHNSVALLMAAAQYLHVPGYAALLLRDTYPNLSQARGLIPLSHEWWDGKAHWNGTEHKWTFPSGAVVQFGYCANAGDEHRYKGGGYQFCGMDELTEFPGGKTAYTFLFRSLRKVKDGPLASVPLRMRATTNPGGPGHEWVKEYFIPPEYHGLPEDERFEKAWYVEDRVFVPARLRDNPSIDEPTYRDMLARMSPVDRAQQEHGDWMAYFAGRFDPSRLDRTFLISGGRIFPLGGNPQGWPLAQCRVRVTVDLACSEKTSADYTVFLAGLVTPGGELCVLDVRRQRWDIEKIPPELLAFCLIHRPEWVGVEANGFQVAIVRAARKLVSEGMPHVRCLSHEGKGKLVRATPAILAVQYRQVYLPVAASWKADFVSELARFTGDPKKDGHDDQVDALAYFVLEAGINFFEPPSSAPAAAREGGSGPSETWEHLSEGRDGPRAVWKRLTGRRDGR